MSDAFSIQSLRTTCPRMSRPRISRAFCSASAGVSASLTPPALPRPPVRTCALTTTGPPSEDAAARASSGDTARRPSETGMPTRRKSSLPWYSCRSTAADSTHALKRGTVRADPVQMGRSVIGLCGGFGCLVGGYVPALWGASAFGAPAGELAPGLLRLEDRDRETAAVDLHRSRALDRPAELWSAAAAGAVQLGGPRRELLRLDDPGTGLGADEACVREQRLVEPEQRLRAFD